VIAPLAVQQTASAGSGAATLARRPTPPYKEGQLRIGKDAYDEALGRHLGR
jgi:hypothetical protein